MCEHDYDCYGLKAQNQTRRWKWRSQGGTKYGLSVNPELQSVSCFPGGLLGDLSSPAESAELPGELEECWEKTTKLRFTNEENSQKNVGNQEDGEKGGQDTRRTRGSTPRFHIAQASSSLEEGAKVV